MADNRVEFRYTAGDVTSTQRYRILHSSQFKLLLIFWGLGLVLFVLRALLPNLLNFFPGMTWDMIGLMALIYVGSFLALLFVFPWVSFQFTRFWRLPLVFKYNSKGIHLAVAGKSGGLRLDWSQVRKVEEAPRAFIVYYEDTTKHFLLPRSAFSSGAERRFLSLVEGNVNEQGKSPAAEKAPEPVEADSVESVEEEDIKE